MKLWPFNYELKFFIAPVLKKAASPGDYQLRPNDGQGPYTSYFQNFIPRKIEGSFYEFLREAIPLIDAGINKKTSLDGHLEVEGNDPDLVDEIQEWFYNVPVNDLQKGLQAFHHNFTSEAFEQGFSIGEYVTDKKRTDIVGLRVADSKWIKFRRNAAGAIDIYQKADGDNAERMLKPDNLLYFSINNENQNPYGVPLLRSCEFVSRILTTMHNSLGNVWERFGDPAFHLHYTAGSSGLNGNIEDRRQKIQTDFNAVIDAKRKGKSGDLVTASGKDSSVSIKIIGADGQVLQFEEPARHVEEQIIGKMDLPPWTLGKHWSTTERLSDNEAEIMLAAIATRQAAKMPYFYNLIRTLLLLRGRTWKKGDWKLKWAQVNLKDILKQSQARFMDAQADMYYLQNAAAAGIEISLSDLAIGKNAKNKLNVKQLNVEKLKVEKLKIIQPGNRATVQHKELSRPTPWPELDKVEDDYLDELKYEWNELKQKMMLILKLKDVKSIQPPPESFRDHPSKIGGEQTKEDIPGLDSFNFTAEQRAMIMQAFKDWLGTFNIAADDSPVTWYYAQAYSLGLIQAVKLIGEERPILDIIKNQEVFDELCANGFKLLKDGATESILKEILPAIDANIIAGSNPQQIASILEKLFGDKNSDWERLVRTEMSSAAEQAKLDEWAEWKVEKVEFVPAPDGCPICFALAGEYPVGQCPIPGTGTHPRCRCSIIPVT